MKEEIVQRAPMPEATRKTEGTQTQQLPSPSTRSRDGHLTVSPMATATPQGPSQGPSRGPLLRTREHETSDKDEVLQNIANEAYKQWPNEAGFDGLAEERGPIELTVKGEIPAWAAGSLYRTGPGACKVEDTPKGTFSVSHWFDGFAHAHRFDIIPAEEEEGNVRVVYSSRRQSDKLVDEIKKRGFRNSYSFGQRRDPCVGLFGKIMSVFQTPRDVHNVSVAMNTNLPNLVSESSGSVAAQKSTNSGDAGHRSGKNTIWVTTDASPMMEVDAETMEPIGTARQSKLHPELKGQCSCAHAQRDPETGDLFNYNLELGRTATYRFFCLRASTGKTDILATVSDPSIVSAYIHSFFLTPSYVVLCVPVSHFGLNGLMIPWQRNIIDSIQEFDTTQKCRWLVVDRIGGRGLVATFDSPAAFFFHSTNSFEKPSPEGKGTDLFCELVEYPNQDIIRAFYYDVLLDRNGAAKAFWGEKSHAQNVQARLVRYRLRVPSPKSTSQASGQSSRGKKQAHGLLKAEIVLSIPAPHVGDLPTINRAYHCRPHRYVYGLGNRGRSTLLDSIVKTDTEGREALLYEPTHGHTPGEPIFVARPPSGPEEVTAEDDGVLLSVVLDGSAQKSYLLCLDARTLTELGRAECEFPIALGFHGTHTVTPGKTAT